MLRMVRNLLTILGLITLLIPISLASSEQQFPVIEQTWPSRTPTPGSGQPPPPTNPPPGGSDPTGTPVPVNSPTPITGELPLQTPLSGGLNTSSPISTLTINRAGECETPPTVMAAGVVAVRSGPGIDFEIITNLQFGDVRQIVGRSVATPWWFIALGNSATGWVSDQAVTVDGYIGNTPIININPGTEVVNDAPTIWSPTPNPKCTPVPIMTDELVEANAQVQTNQVENGAQANESETIQASSEQMTPTTQFPDDQSDQSVQNSDSDLDQASADAEGNSLIWVPVIGFFLLILGTASYFIQRKDG